MVKPKELNEVCLSKDPFRWASLRKRHWIHRKRGGCGLLLLNLAAEGVESINQLPPRQAGEKGKKGSKPKRNNDIENVKERTKKRKEGNCFS